MSVVSGPQIGKSSHTAARASTRRLIKILGWVALGHLVLILILSPQLYWRSNDTPEALFTRGEEAMQAGKYAEAQELFRKVMDQQPKPPPIYVKAADNHRLADRLARQAADKAAAVERAAASATTKPAEAVASAATTQPMTPPPTTQRAKPFVPPELRPRDPAK